MSQTVAQLTVETLLANDIEHLYCVPGVQNDDFFDALYDHRDRIKPINARHEQGAVYMALGAALATGRPQAFSIVPGPGFLNGCAALCTAYALNAPLFGVIGQIPSPAVGKELGLLHEINDQIEILKRLTKHGASVVSAEDAVAQLDDAWSALHSGRPRPVGVEIPVDLWRKPVSFSPGDLVRSGTESPAIDKGQLAAAAALIRDAKRPLIAVGSGAQDHAELVQTLARSIGAGVIAFRTGHGVMPSDDPLSLNTPSGHRLWPECDLVIGLGSRLITQKKDWGVDDDLKILHIDIDAEVLSRVCPATVGIHADLADALPRLLAAVGDVDDPRVDWRTRQAEVKSELSREIEADVAPQLGWLQAIRGALPANGLFVDELTQIGFVSRFAFPSYLPRTFLSTGYQGTLGWGIATAIGAAHARRDVPVVSIAGDGGALFTITELASAVHHNIPVNVIVMNDNAFGNVKSIQRDKYAERYIASDLSSPDFVQLARSFGVTAARATTPEQLSSELAKAIAHDGPNLIEVPVDEFPSPWKYILMPKNRGV